MLSKTALPQPLAAELAHSESLSRQIRSRMTGGPLAFAEFMRMALYEPGLGYYMAGLHKFGAAGDFVTAPELSPLFSYCLAQECMELAQNLLQASVLEIGAGSGTMAADILRYMSDRDCLPPQYFILELSAELRQRQRQTLQARVPDCLHRVQWLSTLENFAFRGMVLANEVLDAMPVHRFYCQADGLHEMCVLWNSARNAFEWMTRPAESVLQHALDIAQKDLGYGFAAGYMSEVNLHIQPWLLALAQSLQAGTVLLIDYGYPRAEYYLPERSMGTLSCHYRHRMHDDPLILVGLQDITAFVDFTAVAQAGTAAGFELGGFIAQAGFLLNCGIEKLCAGKMEAATGIEERLRWTQQLKTLLLPSEMGERFKVLALHKGYNRALRGFGNADQRHRL